jgi:multiple sugar transport system substrate-binding protein
MKPTSTKRLAAGLLACTIPLTMAACAKGGTSSAVEGGELTMWTHNAGNEAELGAINAIVNDYNASQTKYKVKVQAFPQDSYNKSVVAAAASKRLPCILDIDGPNVPNWVWAGYLAPIEGIDDVLSKYLPSTVGEVDGKIYSYGYYEVALVMVTRASILDKYGIRVPTIDQPWDRAEFDAALKTIKDSGDFDYPLDIATSFTGEWWPYAYSPMLQSFGGDLIDRDKYESAEGVLNGPEAVEWATWFHGLIENEYAPLKSGADPAKDFIGGKTAILYNGTWTATDTRTAFGDDTLFLPPPDLGQGPKIGGGSWQWGVSTNCADPAGAMDYMKFAAQDKYVAAVARDTKNIPATDAAAAEVEGYRPGEENEIFREYSKEFTVLRPVTAGYPFIATEFTKTAQDILNGADPQAALDQAVKNIDANQKSNGYFK